MAKIFNEDQQQVVDSISSFFSGQSSKEDSLFFLFLFIGCSIAVLLTLLVIVRSGHRLRGRMIWVARRIAGEQRPQKRYMRKANVTMVLPQGPNERERTITVDLSVGGMFVKMADPLPENTNFEFLLHLGDEMIKGFAEVIWSQTKWTKTHPSGIGCRFLTISPAEENKIRLYLRK